MSAADPTAPDLPRYGVGPVEATIRFWRRYAVFTGRASRSEYWWAALVNAVAVTVLTVIPAVLGGIASALEDQPVVVLPATLAVITSLLLLAYVLGAIVPSIAISVRRLHDSDLTGLLCLIALVPYVGVLIVMILNALPSNPAGRRFDAGATGWSPTAALPPRAPHPAASPLQPAPRPVAPAAPVSPAPPPASGDWAAPGSSPATTPVPLTEAPEEVDTGVWRSVGTVRRVDPPFTAAPAWRRQTYVLIETAGGLRALGTDGLSISEGSAALGTGAEVWMATAAETPGSDSWQLALLAGIARRLAATRVHLPAELEQYGAISMALPGVEAPAGLRGADGTVGVLLGVDGSPLPETVATPLGEVRLVRVVPLRPEELQRIVTGGRDARAAIAAALAELSGDALLDPDRPAV